MNKINVFGYEYQGYGITKPKVKSSEARCYASIEAAVEYLTSVRKIPTSKIIIFGTSLGTGPSVHICSKFKFRGLVLQSPFTSVVRIKVDVGANMFFDMFANIDKIHSVDCPVFIIHGKVDEVVPFQHALVSCCLLWCLAVLIVIFNQLSVLLYNNLQILKDKVKKLYKPLFIDYAGHNNIMEILSVERYVKKLHEFLVYLSNEEKNQNEQQQQSKAPSDESLV